MKRLAIGAVGLAVVAMASACGGAKSDDEAIEDLFRQAAGAFNDRDVDTMVGLASKDCREMEEGVIAALGRYRLGPLDFVVETKRVYVSNLEEDSAEASVEMTAFLVDEEGQAVGAVWPAGQQASFRVVKEEGRWKIADCDYFELQKYQAGR